MYNKLLDPYLPGFHGGTVSKLDSADLYVYSSSLYAILLSTGNQCNPIKARDKES